MSPQLLVVDIKRSIEFYTKTLGFAIEFQYDDFYIGITKDSYSIHLKSGKPSIEERMNKKNNDDLDIVFSVDGIDDLYQQALSSPTEIIKPLRDMPYGKEFYIADPDSYIIAFLQER
jgi:predicted enzyme related to lactoylglutathione lyase